MRKHKQRRTKRKTVQENPSGQQGRKFRNSRAALDSSRDSDSPRTTENGIVVLPKLKYRVLLGLLKKLGYKIGRSRSTHVHLRGDGLPPVTVPKYTDVAMGTLRDVIKQLGMSKEEFVKFYNENK
jgi:predicted RNA binding protein YcfA (HicA-like mRNA interferase family)